jgi:hypothetical protein
MGSQNSLSPGGLGTPSSRTSYRHNESDSGIESGGINAFLQNTALYIFGDRSQVRNMKLDAHPKAQLVPVEFPEPRRIRTSFKKLMRACVPSAPTNQVSMLKNFISPLLTMYAEKSIWLVLQILYFSSKLFTCCIEKY